MASNAPDLTPIYQAAGREWNVDPNLIAAVAGAEGGGTSNVSPAGAQGHMQIMPGTQAALGVTDPNDVTQSVYGGAKYLSQMLDKYHDPQLAVAAYNAGPGRVDAYLAGQATLPAETAAYVPSVTKRYQAIVGPQVDAQATSALDQKMASLRQGAAPQASPAGAAPPSQPTAAPEDPGEAILNAYSQPASAAPPAPASNAPPSPGEDILKAYASQPAPANSNTPAAPPTSLPLVNNLYAGAKRGFQDVADTFDRAAAYVDNRVPFLNSVDNATGQSPQPLVAAQPAAEAAYQKQYGGSVAAGVGRVGGNILATAPLLGPVSGAVGDAGGAVAEGLGGAATALGRGVQAGTDVLTGTAAAPGAGFVPNALVRGTSLAVNGAGQGAAFNALTGGDPAQGAKMGMILAPAGNALVGGAGAIAKGAASVVGRGYNALTGSGITKDIESALAPGREVSAPVAPVNPLASGTPAAGAPAPANAPATGTAAPAPAPTAPSGAPAAPAVQAAPVAPVSAAPLPAPAVPLTASQATAAKASAEMQRLTTPPPKAPDDTQYIPGVTPTEAEVAGNANTSLAQARIYDRNPQPFDTLQTANTQARIDHFNGIAGDASSLEALNAARSQQAETDLTAAFANKTPVDAQPVADQINAALAGPAGKLTPVRQALGDVASALQKSDGSGLETDPEMLYGARKQINYLLSKTGQRANPAYADSTVISQLQGVKSALDGVIEPGAPGYQQYLQNYATASKPIDTQELLQAAAPTIATPNGMTFNRVQNLLKQVVTQRQAPGINAAKSIDDDTMNGLFSLRDDLARKSNIDLGKSRGSNTNQNASVADAMGLGAAQLAASHVPFANALIGQQVANVKGKALDAWTNRLLNPPPVNPLSSSPP